MSTTERVRGKWNYVTADGKLGVTLDIPFGLIAPPTLELHRPMVGTVIFYHVDGYQITVAEDAYRVDASGGGG